MCVFGFSFNKKNTPHLFLKNTTSKSRLELVTKLAGYSIKSKKEDFLTPCVAARQWLQSNNLNNIALFVPETTKAEFSDFNLITDHEDNTQNNVDAVVIGDLGQLWTFDIMTRYWRAATGLQLDVAPMIKAF